MRFSLILITALLAAGCARTPEPQPVQAAPSRPGGPVSALIGLTASELIVHFGQPRIQVREGPGLKMQWTSASCVLDVYLYPDGAQGRERANHVDTRLASGDRTDQRSCVATLTR